MENISTSVAGKTTKTITMHQLLADIKLTKSKLESIDNKLFVSSKKHADTTIQDMPIEKVNGILTGNLDSIRHLISNLTAYETARYLSNSSTMVEIGGMNMTVADAIKRKENIVYEEKLLRALENQYKSIQRNINNANEKVQADAKSRIDAVKTDSMSATELMALMQTDIDNNTVEIVDPNNIADVISEMRDAIEKFKTNVDAALSTSNAITTVTVTLYD